MSTFFYGFEVGTNGSNVSVAAGAAAGETVPQAVTINTSTGGVFQYSSTRAAHGTLSGTIYNSTTANSQYLEYDTTGWGLTQYARIYVYLTALPSINQDIWQWRDSSNRARVRISNTGKVSVVNSTSQVGTATSNIPINQWVRIEAKLVVDASAGILEVKYFSGDSTSAIETITVTGLNTGTVETNTVRIGSPITIANVVQFWIDDVAGSNTGYLGPATIATVPGSAALTSTSSLTSAASVTVKGAAALGSVPVLTASGGLSTGTTVTGSATLSSAASITAGGFVSTATAGGSTTNNLVWLPAANAFTRTNIDHDSYERLHAAIPRAFLSENGAQIQGDEDTNNTLDRVFRGLADVYDGLLTDADLLLRIWDLNKTPVALVPALSATMGVPYEPALGPKPQRKLTSNATRIYSNKGNTEGLGLVAECASGVEAEMERGKNLFPNVSSSGFEHLAVLTSALLRDVNINDTEIVLDGVGGWPIEVLTNGGLTQPIWIVVRSSGGVEPMLVTAIRGTKAIVDRGSITHGVFGFEQKTHPAGALVTVSINWHGWSVTPGYDYQPVGVGDVGAAMPTSTITDQPPLQSRALKITCASTIPTVTPRARFGQRRYVSAYRRVGSIGYIQTREQHDFVVGQRVRGLFGLASATPSVAAQYTVTSIQDPYTFTIYHPENGLSDVTMSKSEFAASAVPVVDGLPHPATMLPVTEGLAYTYSVWVRAETTTRAVFGSITWYDGTGSQIGSTVTGSSTVDSSTGWTRIAVTAVAPTAAVVASVALEWSSAWTLNEAHYITQAQFEQAAAATDYDDGSLILVGLHSRADIDPAKVIRTRTRDLLTSMGAERRYRVVFTNSAVVLPLTETITSSGAVDGSGTTDWATTEIDLMMRVNLTTLTGGQTAFKASDGTGRYWRLAVTPTALVLEHTFTTGSGLTDVTSTAHGLTAGSTVWIRVTRDPTSGDVTFYKAPDSQSTPITWTVISTGITAFGGGTTTTSILSIEIGGSIYLARLTNNAAIVAEMDPVRYDPVRDRIANGGLSGGPDWVLSSNASVSTTYP